MKGFDPKWVFYLGIAVTIESAIGHGSVSLINVVPLSIAPYVTGWCTLLAFIGTVIMTAMSGYSSNAPGLFVTPSAAPAAPVPSSGNGASPASKAVALLAILILGALLMPTPGYAQNRQLTGNIVNDFRNAKPGVSLTQTLGDGDMVKLLAKPFQDMAEFLSSDAAAAIALSTQIPALQDGHGQQCWIAMSTAGDVFKAHPVPLTLKVMTDIEALRLLAITANNLCVNVHCTQVFADLTTMAQAASPVALPIPSLHDLCSKIPQIAQVAAVTPPANLGTVSTPAPAATPAAAPSPQP